MPLELICGDRSSTHYRDWSHWLETCSGLYDRFIDELDISPFGENEQSMVGFLAAAAAIAGYLPIVEMSIEKTRQGLRGPTHGRSDLWIDFPDRTYSFEVKRAKFMANKANLSARLGKARADIARVGADEHDEAAALLAADVRDAHREPIYREFALEPVVSLAVRFGPFDKHGAFLFFGMAER